MRGLTSIVGVSCVLGLVFGLGLNACGGASVETRTAYAAETARCLMQERAIVDRASTAEEDARDLEAERARCDAALRAIEGGQ